MNLNLNLNLNAQRRGVITIVHHKPKLKPKRPEARERRGGVDEEDVEEDSLQDIQEEDSLQLLPGWPMYQVSRVGRFRVWV